MNKYKFEPIEDAKQLLLSTIDETNAVVLVEKLLDQHALVEEVPPSWGQTEYSCGCYYDYEYSWTCHIHALLDILEKDYDYPSGISEENKNRQRYARVVHDIELHFLFGNYIPSEVYSEVTDEGNEEFDDLEELEEEQAVLKQGSKRSTTDPLYTWLDSTVQGEEPTNSVEEHDVVDLTDLE